MAETGTTPDVTIVGGGLVGLSMALALGGRGARPALAVRLLDAGDPEADFDAGSDSRASAITLSSRRLFEALNVWYRLDIVAEPIRSIVVTDSSLAEARPPALLSFDEGREGPGPSAFMVENRHLHQALREAAAEAPDIEIVGNVQVRDYAFEGLAVRLATSAGDLATRLAIAADGRRSAARTAASIGVVGWSYGQSAITTTVEHEWPHEGRAEEHFLPAGPFAVLPLPGNRCSLVWTETDAEAARIMALEEEAFVDEMRRRLGERLGTARPVGPRHCHPLGLQIAKRFVSERLALIGDAAHVVHPIAGLGFNLGLRDVAALAESVSDAARLGLDVGSPTVLERYERWRRPDTLMVALATDGLNRLFSNDNALVRAVRDLGLGAVDRLPGLKQAFASEAAGLTGRLPRLLTGEPA